MELDDLLGTMDRTAANLAKLEDVWERAETFIRLVLQWHRTPRSSAARNTHSAALNT